MTTNSIQPTAKDDRGTIRFKANPIVRYLLDNGGIDMNQIAMQEFSNEDQQHFAQLIGYSVSGWGGLSYVNDDTYQAVYRMSEEVDEKQARIDALTAQLDAIRNGLLEPVAALYGKHPEDLLDQE